MRRATVAAIAGAGVLSMMAGLATSACDPAARDRPALRAPASGGLSVRYLPRPLPRVLYGVTADDVTSPAELVAGARHLPDRPTTRIYFDVSEPPGHYGAAVRRLHPVSYLMGELLDSSDEKRISVAAYRQRVQAYLDAFGNEVDLWEIGNEVNGNWTGHYPTVAKKLIDAYREVKAVRKRTALTLYYNAGCGDGAAELSPLTFSRRYVPPAVRNGITHVFLSYYEEDCHGLRPTAWTWQNYFRQVHALYPHALVGFGEIGLNSPVTRHTIAAARSLIGYYYGLRIRLPYYAGGYFWWHYAEDCLPYSSKPLWPALQAGFRAEAASLR